jgi:hypothetical protein
VEKDKLFDIFKNDQNINKTSIINEIFTSIIIEKEHREKRLNICLRCEKLNNDFCTMCCCYMPLKTFFKNTKCPLGKFDD